MSEIKVPEAMRERIRARVEEFLHGPADAIEFDATIDAFAEELAKNPVVPTDAQVEEMKIKLVPVHPHWANIVCEWQRRMFLAEPEIPEEVKDLCRQSFVGLSQMTIGEALDAWPKRIEEVAIESYRLGRASRDGDR